VRTLLTPRWLLVHAAVVVLVVAFGLLCWWQVTRAAAGNLLSFGYAIEWPAFAGFLIFVWIREMRKALHARPAPEADADAVPAKTATVRSKARAARREAAYDDSDDPALAAYNHYLAWLNEHPHATPADYPGAR
jgi:DNA-binding transcriptional regulator of glucitol operon